MVGRVLRPILAVACVLLAISQVCQLVSLLTHKTVAAEMDSAAAVEGPFEVGFTREGVLSSSSQVAVRVPDRLAWNTRVTFIVPDGTKVKKGDLIAKVDVSQYRFEVDRQNLQYQQAVQQVGQSKRKSEEDAEQASQELTRQTQSVETLGQSTSVETEQARAQVGYDTWNLDWSKKDYARQERLRGFELVPGDVVQQAERQVRAKEYSLTGSEKNLDQKQTESKIKQSQSAADVDTARFSLGLAQRRVKDSERDSTQRVKRAKEELDKMQADLGSGELRSPGDGMAVLSMTWDENSGQRRTLRAGDRVRWGALCMITDPTQMEVSVRVTEARISQVKLDQEVVVTAEGVPGRRFKGKVATVSTVASAVPPWDDPTANANERAFDVTVKMLDVDPKVLRPGMKAKAEFVLRRLPKAIAVPLIALTHRPGQGEFVYVQRGSVFEERKVESAERNDEAVVVRRGLRAGERVALGDPTKLEVAS